MQPATVPPPPLPQRARRRSPLNQPSCLFNYGEQRGSRANSFSRPLISLFVFFFYPLPSSPPPPPPPLCHPLCLDFPLRLPPPRSSPSLFPPHLPCSPISARSICLTAPFRFFFLRAQIALQVRPSAPLPLPLYYFFLFSVAVTVTSLGFSYLGTGPPSIYLGEWAHPSLIVVKYYGGVTTTKPPRKPHAIFTGDDIRFPLMKKKKKRRAAGITNSSLITGELQGCRRPAGARG